ncbi:hypothetical protein [Halosimplex salinum]|uniref:hypothetical protein n=1 Tax=Halosimplex salinum TaxID=1710538 RepID=UPI000F4A569E|nr:hypothetical protein [Halosimplex salinum]
MAIDPETVAVAAISLLGAVAAAVVTLRHYDPPPREDVDAEPDPYFEAVVFFFLTAVLFAVLGFALSFVVEQASPYGRIATLLLTPIGLYSAYATYTGRIGDDEDSAGTLMGVVSAVVLGVYPLVFGVLSSV